MIAKIIKKIDKNKYYLLRNPCVFFIKNTLNFLFNIENFKYLDLFLINSLYGNCKTSQPKHLKNKIKCKKRCKKRKHFNKLLVVFKCSKCN